MNRYAAVFSVISTLALTGVAGSASAHGQPPPPGTPCSFTLSAPQVVQVAGKDVVAVSVTPEACGGPFSPRISVVCVQRANAASQCSQARDTGTATVYTDYLAGETYTATGRGLGAVFNDASEPNWQLLGPITATP